MASIALHIFVAPIAAFFMSLLWAATFGDTIYYFIENNMTEEWIICIFIYVFAVLLNKLKLNQKKR